MKIFAIYLNVELVKKPEWLDEFRKKYDKPYEIHITLKQPCYIEEDRISELREKVLNYFNSINISKHKIEITFDEILRNKDKEGVTIMIKASNPDDLIKIQKELCYYLNEYTNYVKFKYQDYENNFVPHITIARNLSEIQEIDAQKYLQNDFVCCGEISSVTLSIVNNNTPEESKKSTNQTVYSL